MYKIVHLGDGHIKAKCGWPAVPRQLQLTAVYFLSTTPSGAVAASLPRVSSWTDSVGFLKQPRLLPDYICCSVLALWRCSFTNIKPNFSQRWSVSFPLLFHPFIQSLWASEVAKVWARHLCRVFHRECVHSSECWCVRSEAMGGF